MFKKIVLISTLLFSANAFSADYLDTQYGDDGLEVHIMKVTFNKNIMTVVFKVENTGDEEFSYLSFPIKQVFFNTGDKKYPVIKDADRNWLASTIAYSVSEKDIFSDERDAHSNNVFLLKPKGKKLVG